MLSVCGRIWCFLQPLKQCEGHQARTHSCAQPSGEITDISFLRLKEQLCVLAFQFPKGLGPMCLFQNMARINPQKQMDFDKMDSCWRMCPQVHLSLCSGSTFDGTPKIHSLSSHVLFILLQKTLCSCHQQPRVVSKCDVNPQLYIHNWVPHQSTPTAISTPKQDA